MHKFIVTHKPLDWPIPFNHTLVTTNGYKQEGAIDASDFIGEEFNLNKTFALFGGGAAVSEIIKNLPDDDYVTLYPYRTFFSSKLSPNIDFMAPWRTEPVENEEFPYREFITPNDLQLNWQSRVLLEFPKEYELVITRPLDLGHPMLEHYARYHHMDDLLFGLAVAVRAGLINPHGAAYFLSRPVFIANFASKVSFFRELYERIWWLAKEIYRTHHIQRKGWQERSINFMLERVISIYLSHKIYGEGMTTTCASFLHVDPQMSYKETI